MNNNLLISLLVHKAILTYEEGEAIAKEMANTIIETNFKAAHKNVSDILKTVKDDIGFIETDIKKIVAKKPKS